MILFLFFFLTELSWWLIETPLWPRWNKMNSYWHGVLPSRGVQPVDQLLSRSYSHSARYVQFCLTGPTTTTYTHTRGDFWNAGRDQSQSLWPIRVWQHHLSQQAGVWTLRGLRADGSYRHEGTDSDSEEMRGTQKEGVCFYLWNRGWDVKQGKLSCQCRQTLLQTQVGYTVVLRWQPLDPQAINVVCFCLLSIE